MGAWGPRSFENDVAVDWIGDLSEWSTFGGVAGALDAVIADKAEYLDADVCEEGIAAAEIVAATAGAPSRDLPDEAAAWARGKPRPDATLIAKAIDMIGAVREKSELRELWENSDDFADWNAAIDDLMIRLNAAKSGMGAA